MLSTAPAPASATSTYEPSLGIQNLYCNLIGEFSIFSSCACAFTKRCTWWACLLGEEAHSTRAGCACHCTRPCLSAPEVALAMAIPDDGPGNGLQQCRLQSENKELSFALLFQRSGSFLLLCLSFNGIPTYLSSEITVSGSSSSASTNAKRWPHQKRRGCWRG